MKNLRLFSIIVLTVLLVVGITACGGNDAAGTDSQNQEEKGDGLAGATYKLTEEEYDDSTMIPDHELIDEYVFADDGTFERSYQKMSVVLVDNGMEPQWSTVKETGTYTIDGDNVSINGSNTGEKEMTLENEDLIWNSEEQDITGNTLKVRRVYSK